MGSDITTQVRNARKRARKLGRRGDLTVQEWQTVLEDFDHSCAYCGIKYADLNPYFTIEHYTPLAADGETCIGNCVPSCAPCNLLKGSLLPEQVSHVPAERMQQIRRYLDARKKGKRQPELLRTPIARKKKRESPIVITQDCQRSEQQLTHGEKITLLSVPHLIFLKLSNSSENLLHAPSYEIGVALTVEECIVLARDLLCAAASPDHTPVRDDKPSHHTPMGNKSWLENRERE